MSMIPQYGSLPRHSESAKIIFGWLRSTRSGILVSPTMYTVSRLCLLCLLMLAVIYAGQLAHAAYLAHTTDPAVCRIVTSTLLPAPVCPGLDWDQHTRFLYSLPGAYLSYPLEIGIHARSPLTFANPQFAIIMLVHVFGWTYLIGWFLRLIGRRKRR